MVGVNVKTRKPPAGLSGTALEDVVRHLDHGTALLAHQVAVGKGGQMVGGRPVTKMGVHDYAEALQLVEVAINGGRI